jgi:hypothetical protein
LKNVRKRRKEGMRRRHIRVMAKMRLSELIRSEDARTGRKNVTTVADMVGASALGALILGVAQRAFAGGLLHLTVAQRQPQYGGPTNIY